MTLDALEERLDYRFRDRSLLETALTHASYAHENNVPHNETLEFLGDAVLQMCTTLMVMERFPVAREGELSRLRAGLVNTKALAGLAKELELGPHLRLGVGEESSGGRGKPSILADALEAVLGAIHQDADLKTCEGLVRRWMADRVEALEQVEAPQGERWKDPCSRLQELAQQSQHCTPRYVEVSQEGPPHEPMFTMAVKLDGQIVGTGTGRKKQEARQAAASDALARLEGGRGPDDAPWGEAS